MGETVAFWAVVVFAIAIFIIITGKLGIQRRKNKSKRGIGDEDPWSDDWN